MTWILGINFPQAKTERGRTTVYHYKSSRQVPVGGLVIVATQREGLVCVEVVSCSPMSPKSRATKWIVGVVDRVDVEELEAYQHELEQIEAKLNALVDCMKDNFWQILRANNAEARTLYKRYSELKAKLYNE